MNKLIHVKGDAVKALVNNDVDYLMHCCNAQGVMGSGIALQIKNTFPQTYKDYHNYCRNYDNLLGSIVIRDGVINIIAQNFYGSQMRDVHYGALVSGFMQVIDKIYSNELYKCKFDSNGNLIPYRIAVPKYMASDRAGGDWEIVKELLESFPSKIEIHCYELEI